MKKALLTGLLLTIFLATPAIAAPAGADQLEDPELQALATRSQRNQRFLADEITRLSEAEKTIAAEMEQIQRKIRTLEAGKSMFNNNEQKIVEFGQQLQILKVKDAETKLELQKKNNLLNLERDMARQFSRETARRQELEGMLLTKGPEAYDTAQLQRIRAAYEELLRKARAQADGKQATLDRMKPGSPQTLDMQQVVQTARQKAEKIDLVLQSIMAELVKRQEDRTHEQDTLDASRQAKEQRESLAKSRVTETSHNPPAVEAHVNPPDPKLDAVQKQRQGEQQKLIFYFFATLGLFFLAIYFLKKAFIG